jgi:hypothetical protein
MKKIIKIAFLQIIFSLFFIGAAKAATCGQYFTAADDANIVGMCDCESTNLTTEQIGHGIRTQYCCGFMGGGKCRAYEDPNEYGCGETLGDATVPEGATCNCEGGQWQSYQQSNILWIVNRDVCCGWVKDGDFFDQCLTANPDDTTAFCGETYLTTEDKKCICGGGGGEVPMTGGKTCCGWERDGKCESTDVGISSATVSAGTLNGLNPITIGGGDGDLTTPGGIISKALGGFIFPIAGIILFVVLVLGGFQMLTGATNSKSIDEGKQRITAAILGFILLFAAYWIAQLLELIFGIRILS